MYVCIDVYIDNMYNMFCTICVICLYIYIYFHIFSYNMAGWKIPYDWRFLARKITYKWCIFHCHV